MTKLGEGVLAPHFTFEEVIRSATAARLGIDNAVPDELLGNIYRTAQFLEDVRALVDSPIRVTSWFRCLELNTAIGGSRTSRHMVGLAADCQTVSTELEVAFDLIVASALPFDQLIIERTRDGARWLHIGLSENKPRRQVLRADGSTLGGPMSFRLAAG